MQRGVRPRWPPTSSGPGHRLRKLTLLQCPSVAEAALHGKGVLVWRGNRRTTGHLRAHTFVLLVPCARAYRVR
jgi:hypothetical protein